jgi:hypothetical protein
VNTIFSWKHLGPPKATHRGILNAYYNQDDRTEQQFFSIFDGFTKPTNLGI